jgi:polysaccharide export outer membrane protein
LLVAAALALSGCSGLPSEGPSAAQIERQSHQDEYVIIDVDAEVVRTLSELNPYGLSQRFTQSNASHRRNVVGVGDVLTVSIWEADKGGLFSSEAGNHTDFDAVVVDARGRISLPYAGAIRVAGLTTNSIQSQIIKRLEGKTIEPQVIVNVRQDANNAITLSGDVTTPGRYALALQGDRLVDVIAKAGGTKFPARETYVTFIRGEETAVQLLSTIMETKAENIYVSRGDQVYLTHDPKRYTVLGAVTSPGIYTFEAASVTVLEAVASAGGLLDERADSTGLFVFRYERMETLEKINVDYSRAVTGAGNKVPTIYRINMRHAKSYFYAQSFLLQNRDSVFVANADTAQLEKLLRLINLGLTPAAAIARYGLY